MAYSEAKDWVLGFAKANNVDYEDIVDMIVKYGFEKDEMKLAFIFNVFGDSIIDNLNKNLAREHLDKGYIMCECCGKRVKNTNGKVKYCEKCAKEVNKIKTNENKKKSECRPMGNEVMDRICKSIDELQYTSFD